MTAVENIPSTRDQLVSTAVQLFAERGLDGVSLAEINRAAGQRNATALHYHFGGKPGLVQAIFDKHSERVNSQRQKILDAQGESPSLAETLAVLVLPLIEQVRDPDGGIHYLRFLAQVMNNPAVDAASLDHRSSSVLQEQRRQFAAVLAEVPDRLRELRLGFVLAMIFNALANYAATVADAGFDPRRHKLVSQQLIAAAVGALDFSEECVST